MLLGVHGGRHWHGSPAVQANAVVPAWMKLVILILLFDSFVFHVAGAGGIVSSVVRAPTSESELDGGSFGSYQVHNFVTTKFQAPQTNFRQWSPECSFNSYGNRSAYYLVTPKGWKVASPGPTILDDAGDLIWAKHFANEFGGQAYNLQVQTYQGENYLTFWLGDDTIRGHGAGHWYMLNSSYDVVQKIGAVNGMYADLHEFLITSEGTALVTAFEPRPGPVGSRGRKHINMWNQFMWDCVFQEIDLKTGEAVFEWRASEHINVTNTYRSMSDRRIKSTGKGNPGTPNNPFDWFHINSVDKDELGNYLVSARYTHAIYYIDGRTKAVLWTLGGKDNYFMDTSNGHAINFAWQHDARFALPESFPRSYAPTITTGGSTTRLLTLFDNAADDWDYRYGPAYSRGMLLELTYPVPGSSTIISGPSGVSREGGTSAAEEPVLSKQDVTKISIINGTNPHYTVRVIREYVHPQHIRSSAQGSMTVLPPTSPDSESHVLIGYGINAVVTEFGGNGTLLCDLRFGAETSWETGDVQSYRAFKTSNWVGRPTSLPAIAARGNVIFVSWNGATEVKQWLLQASRDYVALEGGVWVDATKAPKDGFETAVRIPDEFKQYRYLRFVAHDASDRQMDHGVSEVLERGYWRDKVLTSEAVPQETSKMQMFVWLFCSAAGLVLLFRLTRKLLQRRAWRKPSALLA